MKAFQCQAVLFFPCEHQTQTLLFPHSMIGDLCAGQDSPPTHLFATPCSAVLPSDNRTPPTTLPPSKNKAFYELELAPCNTKQCFLWFDWMVVMQAPYLPHGLEPDMCIRGA
jgi:hypothetical protein